MNADHHTKSICLLAGILLLGACSHDAKRDNPLDPALTPPVEVQITVDDSASTATLTWTAYEGEAPFREYRVLRNVADRISVDTLAVLSSIEQTTFVDSTLAPEVTHSYRILTINASGLEVASVAHIVRLQQQPPVQVSALEFNSQTASVDVRWSQYSGRDFSSYQVTRSSGFETRLIAQTQVRRDTTFVDSGLRGGTEYTYQVDVFTKRGETISSATQSGMFHQLTDSWPVDVEDDGYIRLYKRDGNLLALVSEPQRIRTIFLDTDGAVLEEQVLLRYPSMNISPVTAVLASVPDGTQYLGLVFNKTALLMAFDPQGAPLYQEYTFDWDVAGEVPNFDLSAPLGSFALGRRVGDGLVDNLTVTSEGRQLISNDFTSDDFTGWTRFERDCAGSAEPDCESVFVPVTTNEATIEGGELVTFGELLRDIAEILT